MLQRSGQRILVVDDDRGIGQFLTRILEESGRYFVETETDPIVAMATALVYKPHLVVLDIYMPNLSGLEIARQLRAEPCLHRIPIIFFTGKDPGELPCGHEAGAGAMEYLGKDSSIETIVATIERLVNATGGFQGALGA